MSPGIFNGLAAETDFGGGGGGGGGAQPDVVQHPPAGPSQQRFPKFGRRCYRSLEAEFEESKISEQGYTSFGGKTNQQFTSTDRMETRGLHLFVNFLRLGELAFNIKHEIDRFHK